MQTQKITALFMCNLFIINANAQQKDSTKPKIFFTSYIGKSNVTNSLKANIDNGFIAMTGIELQFKTHHTIYGEINFDSYNYNKELTNISINNSLNTMALTVGYKQYFTSNKFCPFIKLGIGVANISYPVIAIKNNYTSITNSNEISFQYQASTGLQYNINKTYGLFADVGFQQYYTKQFFANNIQAITYKIGITSSL